MGKSKQLCGGLATLYVKSWGLDLDKKQTHIDTLSITHQLLLASMASEDS